MKKNRFFLFLLIPLFVHSQHFTNASVFDYEVGDTIVTSFWHYIQGSGLNGPPTYHYKVFTQKNNSPNNDTIFYQIKETRYTPPASMNDQAIVRDTVLSFYVTNLTDTVINNLQTTSSCQTFTDSITQGYCNLFTYTKQSLGSFSCTSSISHTVIEGVGTFFQQSAGHSNPPGVSFSSQFVSASKVGKNCGVVGSIPTGLRTYSTHRFSLFPNPNNGEFYIEVPTTSVLRISNCDGKIIDCRMLEKGNQKVILNEAPGIYFLQLNSEQVLFNQKLVISR